MTSIKIILFGIILILASLFFMGVLLLVGDFGGLAVVLFILGILTSVLGFLWDVKR